MSEPPDTGAAPDQAGSSQFQASWSFLEDVKGRFEATQPEVYPAVIQILSSYYMATRKSPEELDFILVETHEKVKALLHEHQDLLRRFESSLPPDYLNHRTGK
ncbi:hypothetical protein EsH8_VI_000880 [Colletotrichum jinshuiense]